jgi:thiamine biosynthesis protein ThiS
MVTLTINGQVRQVKEHTRVSEYLESLGLTSARVAVEKNRCIVPRAQHATERLEEGDEVEIVHFVGGG